MTEIWENEYLALLAEIIGASAEKCGIREVFLTEQAERPVLIMIPDLPSEGFEEVVFRITIEHILEGTNQLHIMVSMYYGVPDKLLEDAQKVVARINEFMVLGHAAIFYKEGLIFYSHAFDFDREMSVETVTSMLGNTLRIVTGTVPQMMDILSPLFDGTATADEVIAKGIDLIQ